MAAGNIEPPKLKQFKPKYPEIPVLQDYRKPAPKEFWEKFPSNLQCPGTPAMQGRRLKQWADAVGCGDQARLNRVLSYIEKGADIGCRGTAREPSTSGNAESAYAAGAQVTDAIAEWVHKGYA